MKRSINAVLLALLGFLGQNCDTAKVPSSTQYVSLSQPVAVDSLVNRLAEAYKATGNLNTAVANNPSLGSQTTLNAQNKTVVVEAKAANEKFEIPSGYITCQSTAPKDIKGLLDGVSLQAYEYQKGDELSLAALGFANITFGKSEKVTVVEFSQTGSQMCSGEQLHYGVGARMMLRIRNMKGNAKVNTPQQISASVTFGRAEVTYSMKTFGIVGPGVSNLVKNGDLTGDTYVEFLKSISELIISMYDPKSPYIVTPQPLLPSVRPSTP